MVIELVLPLGRIELSEALTIFSFKTGVGSRGGSIPSVIIVTGKLAVRLVSEESVTVFEDNE